MNEEEFKKYLQTFVQDIWSLLTRVSLEPRQVHPGRVTATEMTPVAHSPSGMTCCAMRRCVINMTLTRMQDGLAMNAIRFLTTVAKSVHHELFRSEDVLKQVRPCVKPSVHSMVGTGCT
jgi:exportin-2 (importin alpha re-exporter)